MQANAFVENVSGALEGDTAQIDQLINSGAAVSTTVKALDTQVGQVIGNLDQVLTACPNATLVSIAHRPSVAQFHKSRLLFKRDEGSPGTLAEAAIAPAVGE